MIVRIVKLHFKKENIASFEQLFEETKEVIQNFDGCSLLELYQDTKDPAVFFTYSYWASEKHLEAYRQSDFFKHVWSRTKLLFEDRPQAWSVEKVHAIN
jgi:quinol monooxygenase YgiN